MDLIALTGDHEVAKLPVLSPVDLLIERARTLPMSDVAYLVAGYLGAIADTIGMDGVTAFGVMPSVADIADGFELAGQVVDTALRELFHQGRFGVVPNTHLEVGQAYWLDLLAGAPAAVRERVS